MASKSTTLKRLFSTAFQTRAYSAPADRSIPSSKQKYVPTSGTYPKGFLAGTSHAGVKPSNTKYDDIALIVSETPCVAAAVFTRNIFKAAPVHIDKQILHAREQGFRGVVVNSGCANAVTGTKGRQDASEMAAATDRCFADSNQKDPFQEAEGPSRTLVMSTGVIGQRLPIEKITEAIPKAHNALGNSHDHWLKAAQAICTTDTFPKLISRTFTLPSHPEVEYRIAGTTKGAGMIHPNMGTLLGIICTDAKIGPSDIRRILSFAVNHSFNCISIDGDTSTNDTVALLANGAAAPEHVEPLSFPRIDKGETSRRPVKPLNDDARAFYRVLNEFMLDLAKLVVRDGEGATKFVKIRVLSSHSKAAARRAATSIATSALVKTALYGRDANWGRILCAVGYAPGIMPNKGLEFGSDQEEGATLQVRPGQASVSFVPSDGSEELQLLRLGEPQEVDEARAKEILDMEDLEILVKLDDVDRGADEIGETGGGEAGQFSTKRRIHEANYWTCDFSHEYVTINGDYRT